MRCLPLGHAGAWRLARLCALARKPAPFAAENCRLSSMVLLKVGKYLFLVLVASVTGWSSKLFRMRGAKKAQNARWNQRFLL
jgi:hypothetical protein